MTAIVPFEHQLQLATAFAKSGLFGVKTTDQALALMALCEAEGLHPAKAVQDYDIIQGKPAKKAQAMLASFLANGGKVTWHSRTDTECEATFSHPSGGQITVDWDMERAKQAKLADKENWKKFPRAMLHARVISEGVRSIFPGATSGLYTPEEVRDFEDTPKVNRVIKEVIQDAIEVVEKMPKKQPDIEPYLDAILKAENITNLRVQFLNAKGVFAGFPDALARLVELKDARKAELDSKLTAGSQEFLREMDEEAVRHE